MRVDLLLREGWMSGALSEQVISHRLMGVYGGLCACRFNPNRAGKVSTDLMSKTGHYSYSEITVNLEETHFSKIMYLY